MAGSSFELLMQEIFNQKQRMDELLEENHSLRRQLAALRAGHGIVLEICGQQYVVDTADLPSAATPAQTILPVQDVPPVEQATISMPIPEIAAHPSHTDEQETISIPLPETAMGTIPETPRPDIDQIEPLSASAQQTEAATDELSSSTFLEEMLIDEFASAATAQIPAWKGSQTRKLPAVDLIDEEEKAALRKQLIGSFLLE